MFSGSGLFRRTLVLWASIPAAVGFCTLLLPLLGPSPSTHTPHPTIESTRARFPLEISPDPVDLGVLPPGRSAQATISLRNPGPRPVSVERIETSCPCIRAEPASFKVGPGELAELVTRFDPSDDPDFRGGLSIEVVGRSPRDFVLFRARVDLEIRVQNIGALQRHTSPEKEGLR